MLNNFIETKRKCELIVTETDLTTVLTVLNEFDCTKVEVSLDVSAIHKENSTWRVVFRTDASTWAYICNESKEVCSKAILIPLKDSFGNIVYHEA